MNSKPAKTYLDHLAWIVPTVVSVVFFIGDHLDLTGSVVSELWQRIFLNIWFIWVAIAAYGAFRFVRFVRSLHRTITEAIPARLNTLDERLTAFETKVRNLVEVESRSRAASDESLSSRLNSLDTRVTGELKTMREEVRAGLAQAAQRESHQRADGINAVQRELGKHFERMNRIETMLSKQISDLQTKPKPPEKDLSPAELLASPRGMIHAASARDLVR